VLAVAGALEATMWHLGNEWDVRIDPDAAEVEALGHPHRPAVVAGPHAGGQTVLDRVGPAHGFVLVVETLHRDHRPEHLGPAHLVVAGQPGHHGGLEEVAAVT